MRAVRTALIVSAIAAAILFAVGTALQAAPVVRAIQTVTVNQCGPHGCTQVRRVSPASGVCIGRDKAARLLVLTCAHGWTARGQTVVMIDGEAPEKAPIIGFDGAKDLCLLAVDHPAPVQVYPVASTVPAIGTQVITQGFPAAAKFRTVPTRIVGYSGDSLVTAATFRQGESGGAVVAGNELVGIIQATSHSDGLSAHVRTIQDFLDSSLGYKPIIGAQPAPGATAAKDKPGQVPPPVLLPEPHPEPLPAPTPGAALSPEAKPVPAPPTHDDIRGIVSTELAKLPAPAPAMDTAKLHADILADLKAELVKQLQAHGSELKQAIADSAAAGKIDPAAFAPILKEVAQGAGEDMASNVAAKAGPAIIQGVLAKLGVAQIATGVGIPTGILTLVVAGAGFLLQRSIGRNLSPIAPVLSALANHLRSTAPASPGGAPPPFPATPGNVPGQSVPAPQSQSAPVAALNPIEPTAAPRQTVVQVPVADPLGLAMQQAQAAILQKNPGISLVDAMPEIQQVASTIIDLQKSMTVQPAPTVDLK